MPRQAEGAVFKGNLKALAQYPNHLGQVFRPRAHEAGILAQNYLLAHLLKGGLLKYMYRTTIRFHSGPNECGLKLLFALYQNVAFLGNEVLLETQSGAPITRS